MKKFMLLSLLISSLATAQIRLDTTVDLPDKTIERVLLVDETQSGELFGDGWRATVTAQKNGDQVVLHFVVEQKEDDGSYKVVCKQTITGEFGKEIKMQCPCESVQQPATISITASNI